MNEMQKMFNMYRDKTLELKGSSYTAKQFNQEVLDIIQTRKFKMLPSILTSCAIEIYSKALMVKREKEREIPFLGSYIKATYLL